MKIKTVLALFLIVLLSSCSNLLHVEKRQYRKGFHIDNFFAFNKQKNVLLSVNDTAVKQVYYQKDSITSEEEVISEDVAMFVGTDSLIAETTIETLYYLPIVKIPNTEKIKDEDPNEEEEEVKPNVFDIIAFISTLVSSVSILTVLLPWFSSTDVFHSLALLFGISLLLFLFSSIITVFSFIIGRITDKVQKKEKNKRWNKRAWASFILTIIIAIVISILFYI